MGAYSEAIKQLRDEIEDEERALAEKRSALDVLVRLEAKASGAPYIPSAGTSAFVAKRQITLKEGIGLIVQSIGESEFNVADVERELLQRHNLSTGRTRIAMKIKELLDRGVIVRTFEGTGSAPHRYVLRGAAAKLAASNKDLLSGAQDATRNGA